MSTTFNWIVRIYHQGQKTRESKVQRWGKLTERGRPESKQLQDSIQGSHYKSYRVTSQSK